MPARNCNFFTHSVTIYLSSSDNEILSAEVVSVSDFAWHRVLKIEFSFFCRLICFTKVLITALVHICSIEVDA